MAQAAQPIPLTPQYLMEFDASTRRDLFAARTFSAAMRLTAYQPYPETEDLEGFPNWRTGLNVYADAMLLLVFEIEAWLGLLRLTYPDREDTPRFVKLIKENLRRSRCLADLGTQIQDKVRPYLVEQRRLEQEQQARQQQGSSRSGGSGENSDGGDRSSSSTESKKSKKRRQKKKGKKKKK